MPNYSSARAVTKARQALNQLPPDTPCVLITMYDDSGEWITANLVTDHEVVEVGRISRKLMCQAAVKPWLELTSLLLKSAMVNIFKVDSQDICKSRAFSLDIGDQFPDA